VALMQLIGNPETLEERIIVDMGETSRRRMALILPTSSTASNFKSVKISKQVSVSICLTPSWLSTPSS